MHNMPEDMRRLVTSDALEYQRLLLANPPSDPTPSAAQGVVRILPQDQEAAQGAAGTAGTRFGEVSPWGLPASCSLHAAVKISIDGEFDAAIGHDDLFG